MIQFSKIRERGVTFVTVVVKDHVISCRSDADELVEHYSRFFGCPAVLLGGQRHRTYGRQDLAKFVANNWRRLPWKKMAA